MKKDKKVFNVKKLYRRTFLLIYDIISVIACSYLAILIRYNFELTFPGTGQPVPATECTDHDSDPVSV